MLEINGYVASFTFVFCTAVGMLGRFRCKSTDETLAWVLTSFVATLLVCTVCKRWVFC